MPHNRLQISSYNKSETQYVKCDFITIFLPYWTDIPDIHPAVEGFTNTLFIGSKELYAGAAVGAEMARHRYYLMGNARPFEEFFGKQRFARRVKEKDKAGFCVHHILITFEQVSARRKERLEYRPFQGSTPG